MTLEQIGELFQVPIYELSDLPQDITATQFATILLGDELHHQRIVLHFFQNGWHRAMPAQILLRQQHDDEDPTLCAIEYEMETTMHGFHATQIHPHEEAEEEDEDVFYLEDDENEGIFIDEMDDESEQRFYRKLEQHFSRFRDSIQVVY